MSAKAKDGPVWLLYPSAVVADESMLDTAPVFEVCKSLTAARRNAPDYGQCAIYTGTIKNGVMDDERFVEVVG